MWQNEKNLQSKVEKHEIAIADLLSRIDGLEKEVTNLKSKLEAV